MCPTRSVADKRRDKLYRRVGQRKDIDRIHHPSGGRESSLCLVSGDTIVFRGEYSPST